MEFTATQIAGLLNGEVIGNPDTVVSILAKIEEGEAGALSFLSNPAYEPYIYTTGSSICIVNQTFEPSKALPSTLTLVKVTDAYACFAQLLALYDSMNKKEAIIQKEKKSRFETREFTIKLQCWSLFNSPSLIQP